MDSVELVMAWEEAFDIKIPDEEAAQLITPARAIDFITAMLEKQAAAGQAPAWSREKVREIIRKTITEQIGVKEFSDDDEFVRVLGVD